MLLLSFCNFFSPLDGIYIYIYKKLSFKEKKWKKVMRQNQNKWRCLTMKMRKEQLTLSLWLTVHPHGHPPTLECCFTPTLHCPSPTVEDQTACLATPHHNHLPPKPSQTHVDVLWQGTNRTVDFCSHPLPRCLIDPSPTQTQTDKRSTKALITPTTTITTTIALPRDCSERLPFVGWTSLFLFFLSGLNLKMEKETLKDNFSGLGCLFFLVPALGRHGRTCTPLIVIVWVTKDTGHVSILVLFSWWSLYYVKGFCALKMLPLLVSVSVPNFSFSCFIWIG